MTEPDDPQGIREAYVDFGDATLWTATQGAGPPLVLCTGGPGDRDTLGHVAAIMDDVTTVHRFDPRACGRSSGGPPFTLAGAIDDLDQLRAHWGHVAWTVAGHSFGALTALAYACAHPEQTTAVIYVSCLVATAADLERATQEFRTSRARSGELGEVDDPARAAEIGCLVAAGSEGMNRQVNDELGADGMRHCSTREFHESLARLDVPVLLVHGEQDPRPRWAAERLAETLPRCELVALPGVGHFPDLEAPEGYREIVRAFLQSVI